MSARHNRPAKAGLYLLLACVSLATFAQPAQVTITLVRWPFT